MGSVILVNTRQGGVASGTDGIRFGGLLRAFVRLAVPGFFALRRGGPLPTGVSQQRRAVDPLLQLRLSCCFLPVSPMGERLIGPPTHLFTEGKTW